MGDRVLRSGSIEEPIPEDMESEHETSSDTESEDETSSETDDALVSRFNGIGFDDNSDSETEEGEEKDEDEDELEVGIGLELGRVLEFGIIVLEDPGEEEDEDEDEQESSSSPEDEDESENEDQDQDENETLRILASGGSTAQAEQWRRRFESESPLRLATLLSPLDASPARNTTNTPFTRHMRTLTDLDLDRLSRLGRERNRRNSI